MKLDTTTHFGAYYDSIISNLGAKAQDASNMLQANKNVLDQLQTMQSNITKVDVNAEKAKAAMYQRAYDASVQLSTVINEMMDMLINHTGSSVSTTTS
jgi:flagellar hook-associated protein 1 FlgK